MLVIMTVFHFSICLFGIISLASGEQPCPQYCTCSNVTYSAVCSGGTYRGVPAFPNFVRNLTFTGMFLPEIKRSTFLKLENLNLECLIFRHNGIVNISADALSHLKHLIEIDFSGNGELNISQFESCILNIKSTNLTIVKINSCGLKTEPLGIFFALSKYNISELSMTRNNIKKVDFSSLSCNLPHLTFLNIAYNNIDCIIPGRMAMLRELQIHHNYVEVDFKLFTTNESCNFPSLKILNLNSNFVNYFENRFSCLDNLEELYLGRNPVKKIVSNTFVNLTSLKTLYLNHLGDRLFAIEEYAFKSESLENLYFAKNKFAFTKTSDDSFFDVNNTFGGIPKLKTLDLSENIFNLSDGYLQRLLYKTPNLRAIKMTSCGFRTIPSQIFSKMTMLELLDLSYNHISSWTGQDVFGNLSTLKTLRLQHNYINVFNDTSFPFTLMSDLTRINLARNPFYCSCENLWFRKWIQRWIEKRPDLFESYPANYFCVNPPDMDGTRLADYFPTDSQCESQEIATLKYICTILSLLGIFGVAVLSLVYKGRWHIRYWIYLYRTKQRSYNCIKSNECFLYSGFVVYSEEDRHWVHSKFLDIIEVSNGHKLCIHYRDFVVGKLIVDNIADCIAESKKIILVLSRAMVQSDWCLFETRLAQRKFLNDDTTSLVIIMLENIHKNEMPRSIRDMINMTTYITWSEEPCFQEKFWTDVLKALNDP